MRIRLLRFLACLTLLPMGVSFAGDKAPVPVSAEETSPFSASLSTGWDSLYMFNGVNQLPGPDGYGSGIAWTYLSLSWSPSENDTFTAATWVAFGISGYDYQEVDAYLTYTRTIGALALSATYALYADLSTPGGAYSNELIVSAAYDFTLGPVTITPGISYDFTLGPEPGNGGYKEAGVGYLEFRIDGNIPVYHEIIQLAPWIANGFSFDYNSTGPEAVPYSGADHFEIGVALPIVVNSTITVSPYVAYSHAWVDLTSTRPDTFWGGVSVDFSF